MGYKNFNVASESNLGMGRLVIGSYWQESLLAVLSIYALAGVFFGRLRFFSEQGVSLISEKASYGIFCFVVCWVVFRALTKRSDLLARSTLILSGAVFPIVAAFGFVLILVSDYIGRRFSFYPPLGLRAEIFVLGILTYILSLLFRERINAQKGGWFFVLLFFQALCAAAFFSYVGGHTIFGDDNSIFLYRMQLLRDNFPRIPFYNTEWNAGVSAHDFYPSGIMSVFYLALPLFYLLPSFDTIDGANYFSYLIPYIFIFIVPLCFYAAARVLRFSPASAALSGVLSLVPSMGYVEWLLRYGTLGFVFSAGIFPLVLALCLRLLFDQEKPRWMVVLALVLTTSLCIRWSLMVFLFLPVALVALFSFRQILVEGKIARIVICGLLILALNLPWMLAFSKYSKVATFVAGSTIPGSGSVSFTKPAGGETDDVSSSEFVKSMTAFQEMGRKVNPLLVLFFIPGVLALSDRRMRAAVFLALIMLVSLAIWGESFKPQLELRRMIIPASFLMALFAGEGLVQLFSVLRRLSTSDYRLNRYLSVGLSVFVFGGVVVSPLTAMAAYSNRSDEKFVFAKPIVKDLADAINQYGGTGRTFFFGFILHELGATNYASQDGGHIAPLAKFAKKPLYAFDFAHRTWSTIDPIPKAFRARGEEGVEEFLNLVNATAVVTFKREWADYCKARPWYREVFHEDRFRLFVRERATGGEVLVGDGVITPVLGGVRVLPAAKEIVIKYRYLPNLRIRNNTSGVELFPYKVFDDERGGGKTEEVSFIGLRLSDEALAAQQEVELGF